jgi:hypothetical protein
MSWDFWPTQMFVINQPNDPEIIDTQQIINSGIRFCSRLQFRLRSPTWSSTGVFFKKVAHTITVSCLFIHVYNIFSHKNQKKKLVTTLIINIVRLTKLKKRKKELVPVTSHNLLSGYWLICLWFRVFFYIILRISFTPPTSAMLSCCGLPAWMSYLL